MIPTAPDSKPVTCTLEEELLSEAYGIIRLLRYYFQQTEPSQALSADLSTAARDFCLRFPDRFRPAPGRPSLATMPAIPATVTEPSGDVRAQAVAGTNLLIPPSEF